MQILKTPNKEINDLISLLREENKDCLIRWFPTGKIIVLQSENFLLPKGCELEEKTLNFLSDSLPYTSTLVYKGKEIKIIFYSEQS